MFIVSRIRGQSPRVQDRSVFSREELCSASHFRMEAEINFSPEMLLSVGFKHDTGIDDVSSVAARDDRIEIDLPNCGLAGDQIP